MDVRCLCCFFTISLTIYLLEKSLHLIKYFHSNYTKFTYLPETSKWNKVIVPKLFSVSTWKTNKRFLLLLLRRLLYMHRVLNSLQMNHFPHCPIICCKRFYIDAFLSMRKPFTIANNKSTCLATIFNTPTHFSRTYNIIMHAFTSVSQILFW